MSITTQQYYYYTVQGGNGLRQLPTAKYHVSNKEHVLTQQ